MIITVESDSKSLIAEITTDTRYINNSINKSIKTNANVNYECKAVSTY